MQLFSRQWFQHHQRKLLWFLNAPLIKRWARWVLRIHRDCPDERIEGILPNCYVVHGKGENEYRANFRCNNKFAARIYCALNWLWWTLHLWDLFADRLCPAVSCGFDTLPTVYPVPGTTQDGTVIRRSGLWANVRDGVGTAYDTSGYGGYAGFDNKDEDYPNEYYELMRYICPFDTSALPNDCTVTAATLAVYGISKANTDGLSPTWNVFSSNQASLLSIAAADYTTLGTTAYATAISYASWNATGYTTFTLNASGIAAISKTASSRFGIREAAYDAPNVTPPVWTALKQTLVRFYEAAYTGTTQDPKLDVTYTPAGGANPLAIFLGSD